MILPGMLFAFNTMVSLAGRGVPGSRGIIAGNSVHVPYQLTPNLLTASGAWRLTLLSLVLATGAQAQTLVWNNGAATGNWNLADPNWSGSVWVNGSGANALFTNSSIGGTINLSIPITAGAITFGNPNLNAASISFAGSTLQAGSLTVQGKSNNGSAYSSNPTLMLANAVSIAGDVAVGRANLTIAGGSLTANRIVAAAGSFDWADVTITNATVWATNGVDGSVNASAPATFQLDLDGGTLYTPYIKVADREAGGNAWLNWNGGMVVATADTNAFVTLYGGNQNTYVGNGGAIINTYDGTAGHNITIGVSLNPAPSSTGGLSKLGAGSLTLAGANNYTGDTTINAGTLTLGGAGVLGGGNYAGDITNNGALNYSSSSAQTLSGVISGNGTLTQAGAGTLTLITSANSYAGGTTITGGILALGTDYGANENAGSLGSGKVAVSGGGQIRFGGTSGYPVVYYYVSSANNFNFNNGQFSVTDGGQHIPGEVTVSNGGLTCYTRWIGKDLYLDGVVNGSGPITVDNFTQSGHQAYTHFSNSGNTWSGTLTIKAPSGSNGGAVSVDANLALASATVGDNNTGIIAGYPALIFATGVTAPVLGALAGSGNIALKDGAGSAVALTVGGNGGNSIYSGVLSDSGSLTKTGGGTLVLSGTNTYLGNTTVNGGTLEMVQPVINTNSTVAVSSGAVLKLDFAGTNAVAGLVLNGVRQGVGVYNGATSAPYLTGPGSVSVGSTGTITLNPATTYQQIYGLGGNFCQGDQKLLSAYNLYPQVFSPTGLNFSFIRLSSSYEVTNANFAGYDAANVAVTTNFRALQPNGRITLSQWSPPENLKSTASVYGGTLAKVGGQYVYTNFANWWARVLRYCQTNSALPDYVSIQNEPDFASSGTNYQYESGSYLNSTESSTKAGYPQALAAVRNAFAGAGLGAQKILGPDTTAIGSSTVSTYLANAAPATVDAIGHHLYGDAPATTGTSKLSTVNSQYPYSTMPKFMTEGNPFDDQETYSPTNQPDWMHLAVTIHNYFTIENANAYLVWNVMYATIGYWNGLPNGTQTYYPLGHFSKFIRPNDWRAQAVSSDTNVLVSLYRHTNSNPAVSDQLILVMINKGSNYSYPMVQATSCWSIDPLQRAWRVYKTANDGAVQQRLTLAENLAGASLSGNRNLTLAPYSITTAIINTGVYSNAPPVFTSTASNQVINPGQTLVITNTASDPNQPAQTLAFTLPGAPAGAALNSTNGLLIWRPVIAQANTTNPLSMVVSDNGSPSLSATQSFIVTVRPVILPRISFPTLSNHQFLAQINGAIGPDYTVQVSTNLVTWTNLLTTNPVAMPFNWADTNAAGFNRRFYRLLLGP